MSNSLVIGLIFGIPAILYVGSACLIALIVSRRWAADDSYLHRETRQGSLQGNQNVFRLPSNHAPKIGMGDKQWRCKNQTKGLRP